MDVLADKLVPWEPMNHEQRLALLAKRTGVETYSLGSRQATHARV
jgi:hypothetical protein